jgi:DNA-binding SARP family transcriptional activator
VRVADSAANLGQLERASALWQQIGDPFAAARCELALARFHGDELGAARAERKLRALGVRLEAAAEAQGLLACLPAEARAPLIIRTLGSFQVIREGAPVLRAEWQSRKARDLLKLLVCRRGRSVPRDALMDALWPDEEPARLGNRLSVALSTLRSVLDPDHRYPPEYFLRADHSVAAINLQHVSVDVVAFLAEAQTGLAGNRERLEDAEALYNGDFLEEDAYEDWAIPLREEARATFIRVARALAEHDVRDGASDLAAHHLRRILERDPYDERAHLLLVQSLAALGQHGEAMRAHRAYGARMDELGIEPAPYPGAPHDRA